MKFSLHGMVTLHSNVLSDVQIAARAGYAGLEIHTDKLWRYIRNGGTSQMLKSELDRHKIVANAIDIIGNVEAVDKTAQKKLQYETQTLSKFASEIGVATIQLNAFEGLDGLSLEENISITAKNIKDMANVGADYDIRFQYEGAAWTPIHSLKDCLRLVDAVGADNFGLVIDFWHFWASRGASPEDIAKLDKNIIYGVHCCGGTRPPLSEGGSEEHKCIIWEDERVYRGHFPGEQYEDFWTAMQAKGIFRANNHAEKTEGHTNESLDLLPVKDWADAVRATGYEGWVSGEFLNDALWEQDNLENAHAMLEGIKTCF